MAFGVTPPTDFAPSSFLNGLPPSLYSSLGNFIDQVDKPDIMKYLAYIYGNEDIAGSINGLLSMVGAANRDGGADNTEWHEKTRRHFSDVPSASTAIVAVPANEEDPMTITVTNHRYIVNDQVLVYTVTDGSVRPVRATVTSVVDANDFVVHPNEKWAVAIVVDTVTVVTKFGSDFPQGTDQPVKGLLPNTDRHVQSYFILKTMFPASGSQLTNIAWITDPATGKDVWVYHGAREHEKRVYDYGEMMMVLGDKVTNTNKTSITNFNMNGTEGLFTAVENRGINVTGYVNTLAEQDSIVLALDRQAGAGEYAWYYDTTQRLKIDDLVAAAGAGSGLTSGVTEQYGTFDNDKDLAVSLGFKSFSRGSYTFHGHAWKLLNDPTLLAKSGAGNTFYKYIMIPMMNTIDAKSEEQFPILQINSKAYGGYSRDMEYWLNGAANGTYNNDDGFDGLKFNYRCEKNLVARGANNLVLGKGV